MISRELIQYLFFGVLTTLVNYGSFALSLAALGDALYLAANVISFFCATLFAYLTNKLFVFCRRDFRPSVLLREAVSFFGARIATFGLEELGLFVFVSQLGWGEKSLFGVSGTMAIKVILSFAAVVLNYAVSKWVIFRKT